MPERAYTKRELDLKFTSLEEKNDAWNGTILQKLEDLDKDKLGPLLEQCKRTNGRVTSLEKWKSYIAGAVAVMTILVVPMLIFLSKQILANTGDIRELRTLIITN